MYLKILMTVALIFVIACGSDAGKAKSVRETVLEYKAEENRNGWAQLCLTATDGPAKFIDRALEIKATCAKFFVNLKKYSHDITNVKMLIEAGFDVVVVYVLHDGDEPILGNLAANNANLMSLFSEASRHIYEVQKRYEKHYGMRAPIVSQVALHEVNGGWYVHGAYYPGNNREDVALAWSNVTRAIRSTNNEAYIVANLNRVSQGERGVSDLPYFINAMPADEYSFNGYNRMGTSQWHTEWQGPRKAIENALYKISGATNYPVSIGETSTVSGDNPTLLTNCFDCSKEEWIRDMLKLRKNESDLPKIKRVTFFNEDKVYCLRYVEGVCRQHVLRDWNVTDNYAHVFTE